MNSKQILENRLKVTHSPPQNLNLIRFKIWIYIYPNKTKLKLDLNLCLPKRLNY